MGTSLKIKKKDTRTYVLYSAIIAIGILLDQLTKWLSVEFLTRVETCPIIRNVIHLTYVENPSAIDVYVNVLDKELIVPAGKTVEIK